MPFWKCFPCRKFKNEEIITILDHSNCTLTDVPPDVLQHERTLEELYLSSNRISALSPQLFYCQGMRVLFVNDNELESLPSAIGSLRHLQSLNLARNSLSTIPENITSCKNLTRLDLSLNNLQKLPDAITGLIALQELLLNETNLEFLPANFGRLINLRILELRSNNLITLPKSISRLSNLNRIDIGANEFTELPEVICQLTQLRELWIDVNRIRRISPNVSNLRELKHFEANNNLLSTLPHEVSYWRNLEVLSISINDIESLPFSIGMLKSLVTLQCEANQLRELPDSICHLENLEELVINHNLILRLPRTIGMLRKLRFFCADQNILRSLPIEICSCNSLVVLSVRMNKIVELPQNIGHLENLQVLNLVDNYISHLPVSVLSLTKLTALWISDNQSQPLVPLQYLNANTKSYLTCFMLPQQAAAAQQNVTQTIEGSDDDSTNSLLHKQEQDQQMLFNGRAVHPTSQKVYYADQQEATFTVPDNRPMGRICFADEDRNQFTTESDPETSPLRRIYFADEVKGSENLATRLMRSPTPYPKELRLMAKLVRNNHQQQQQQEKKELHYLDAMLVPKASPSGQINEKTHLSETLPPSASTGGVKEARILFNPSGSSVFLQQMPNSISYHLIDRNKSVDSEVVNGASDLPQVQYLKKNNIYTESVGITNNIPNSHPQQSSFTDLNNCAGGSVVGEGRSTPTAAFTNQVQPQQQYYQHYHPHQQMYLEQHQQSYPSHSPLLYDNQQSREELNNDISGATGSFVPQVSVSPSKISSYSQQSSQHSQYSLYDLQTSKPPPYHIARTYTKKSREDLLSYDTFHSKIQNHPNGIVNDETNNVEIDERHNDESRCKSEDGNYCSLNDNQMGLTTNHHSYLNDNDFGIVDHQNNNNTLNRTYSLDCHDGLNKRNSLLSLQPAVCQKSFEHGEAGQRSHSKLSQHQQQNWNGEDGDDETDSIQAPTSMSINVGKDLKPPLRSGSTTAWLFGLHKNPTVKQVAIKRDHEIGFEIVEKSNQGIFVSGTQPNTSAALLLHPNDKLLEVNGYDFTKIGLVDAQEILENSGPLINVMISRT
ncbi:protein lap1 [Episyrphus balteatus]|uniref:protein lap1 n=1 Tax=Episyrphus balteatus TaxID=286459 RepID=UPI0024867101|nr:protein lap1 [Episyrphus balteatus]XP_055858255.1 protein lap1 [Episyrphus balteatus]XP_055858256.1 protein lap1 [Episyrphus balteatus]